MTDLILPLKREYFEAIKAGTKTKEYRLCNPYWRARLINVHNILYDEPRQFDRVILTLGYPRGDAAERRIVRPWRGYTIKTITHPHFGPEPVHVYAIDVRPE